MLFDPGHSIGRIWVVVFSRLSSLTLVGGRVPEKISIGLLLLGFVICTGCTHRDETERSSHQPQLVFRLANELKPDSKIWDVSRLFKEEIEKASPDGRIKAGEIKVVFYDQGMVGTERQLLETCFFNVVEMVQVNSSVVTTVDTAFSMLDLPYLFVNEEHHKAVLYGDIGIGVL